MMGAATQSHIRITRSMINLIESGLDLRNTLRKNAQEMLNKCSETTQKRSKSEHFYSVFNALFTAPTPT